MTKSIARSIVSLALLGGITYAVVQGTACSDDDNNTSDGSGLAGTSGGAGTGGPGGSGGTGGTGGGATATRTVQLSGTMEVPSNSSAGTGTVMVTLDAIARSVSVTGTFSGLGSNATMAHIHGPAAAGANADVILPLTVTSGTSGTISGNGTLTTEQVVAMATGQTYVNVHTVNIGAGEIRGQINP